jgi:hypothetical protein
VFSTLKANKDHRDLYLKLAGLFSTGNDPDNAWMMAAEAFRYYLATGEVPVKRIKPDGSPVEMTTFKSDKTGEMVTQPVGWSQRSAHKEKVLAWLKYLIEREGSISAAMQWLTTEHSRTDINKMMTESGHYKDGRFTTVASQVGTAYGLLAVGENSAILARPARNRGHG